MYFTKRHGLLAILSFLLVQETYAITRYTPECPKSVKVIQRLSASYPGWRYLSDQNYRTVSGSGDYRLNAISMYVDEPEQQVLLQPEQGSQRFNSSKWRFHRTDKIYMTCEYQDTSVQLTQPLPDHTTQCDIFFQKDIVTGKGPVPDHVVCYK